jgi:3-hydroxyisobutyrate dehydrogenase-like beta-hydroxyacid dehydrogenase
MKQRITVLGTGRMGSVLALALHAKGYAVTVWNRTASKAQALAAKGLRVATSVEEAVSTADVVIGNVSDYVVSDTLTRAAPVAKALRDKLFVQLATGTPRQAREGAAWAREHGVRYLDGAIMATPDFIATEGCTIVYSGAKELYDGHAEIFGAFGGNALHVGTDIGHANAFDAAILVVLWGAHLGVWHGAAICEAEGFPLEAFASGLGATMPVFDGSLQDAIKRIATRRFAADATTAASVDICHASARLIDEISKEHGIHRGLTSALDAIFRRAIDAGRGADDLASAYQGMRGASSG